MKTSVLPLLLLLAFAFTSPAFAKRSAPAQVAPVKAADVEYRVPHDKLGCVEAWDVRSDQMLWRKQVYVVRYDVELERDIQDVFITSVAVQNGKLLVKNEHASEYLLDLETLQVEATKGPLVETTKR